MLQTSLRYLASLAMQMESYTKPDGDLLFAQYVEDLPAGYRWPMWALLQHAATITKDRRFAEVARRMTPRIGKEWCSMYGC
ncbi:hypothetical protein [Microvirga terricola]|uniref:Uncharacterized protein n=1 Tax=Microvirga terricola TaxID=2719797 RepID=A0ABX0VAG1_9HYPH|nr:hypothetical protein [Microvirga terricola]NIX76814.1 hypothetical protein [Microvirga terricola]